jgi:hypothetical protein
MTEPNTEKAQHESCLDRRVPLGYPQAARAEIGPDARTYYRRKHQRGERGEYFGLHLTMYDSKGH